MLKCLSNLLTFIFVLRNHSLQFFLLYKLYNQKNLIFSFINKLAFCSLKRFDPLALDSHHWLNIFFMWIKINCFPLNNLCVCVCVIVLWVKSLRVFRLFIHLWFTPPHFSVVGVKNMDHYCWIRFVVEAPNKLIPTWMDAFPILFFFIFSPFYGLIHWYHLPFGPCACHNQCRIHFLSLSLSFSYNILFKTTKFVPS